MISITILILVVSFSYAYIKLEKQEKETNLLGTDCIKLEMEEVTDALTLTKTYPMTDENGEKTEPFTFRLRNDCGVGIDYQINLRVEDTTNPMEAEDNIATKLDNKDKVVLTTDNKIKDREPEEYKISKENLTIQPYGEVEHNVRIWLDKDAGNDTQNKTFKSRIIIEATQNQIVEKYYKEAILHGADPVLNNTEEEPLAMLTASGETTADTLVPVIIDETTGKVTKADITQEWYDYETKKWANAVILVDNSEADTIQPGEIIEEDQIESYFVWIPKYRYKLFDMGTYTDASSALEESGKPPIEIEFGLEDTKDEIDGECKTPSASKEDGTCQVGKWMTHSAFTAFSGSKGMWVGKFETGYNQNLDNSLTNTTNWTKENAEQNENNRDKIIIKPNVYDWRNISVGNAYKSSFNYQRELDSHEMKNTEWGAVAYLTQSKYGRCDNNSCTEVVANKNASFKTGYNEDLNVYPQSKDASTTGNNTGIFDMNGGAWEYVMGVVLEGVYNAENISKNIIQFDNRSELTIEDVQDLKYIDFYITGGPLTYNIRILGDATGEMGPFHTYSTSGFYPYVNAYYQTYARMACPVLGKTFLRGGEAGNVYPNSGVFCHSGGTGQASGKNSEINIGFRIVLTPTNEAM